MLTQKDLDKIEELIDRKLDEKIKFLPTKDDFYNKMDELMVEIKAVREEQETHSGQHSEINDTLETHETQIKKLAKQIGISI